MELPFGSMVPRKIAIGCGGPTKRPREIVVPLIVPDTLPPGTHKENVSAIDPVTEAPV